MTVAVLPGDGIGPEVTAQAVRVLNAVRPDVQCIEALVGAAALRAGKPALPQETRALCDRSDAILFGSVGDAQFDDRPFAERPEAALFALRANYELFANLRPVRAYRGLEHASALRPDRVRGLDMVVVRELTGGIYFGAPKECGNDWAVDTMRYTAAEVARIALVAFDLARRRRRHVTSVDKRNILATSRLWRSVVIDVAKSYPDVTLEHLLVDNASMQLVRRPCDFDVILTENLFGDILSDEAAILTGSIGNLPSASLTNGASGSTFGMYEPVGGTAPDISGKGIANPTGAILSSALLLRHSLNDERAAARIEHAVECTLVDGLLTTDLALPGKRSLTTSAFGDEVLARIDKAGRPER
jgi:3-isopropylmalate dehydrogenase